MTSQTGMLIKAQGSACHYCGRETKRIKGNSRSRLRATKDHVVPKSFGGRNALDNYVLACAGCNNKRGTALFFCKCSDCSFLITMALLNDKFIKDVFGGIVKHNKPVVKRLPNGRWNVRGGHTNRTFDTWEETMDYAHNGTFMKGE